MQTNARGSAAIPQSDSDALLVTANLNPGVTRLTCSPATSAPAPPPPYTPLSTTAIPLTFPISISTSTVDAKANAGSTPQPPHSKDTSLSDPEKAALASYLSSNAASSASASTSASASAPAQDTLHFLDHERDTIPSLSLRYGVPAAALRQANNLGNDHLLAGRRIVVIPGQFYKGGVSLSPRPVEGEEEEARKAKIRRWMVMCKVADYDVAVFYLEQAAYDLNEAVEAYFADEAWERENPRPGDDVHFRSGGIRKSLLIGRFFSTRGRPPP